MHHEDIKAAMRKQGITQADLARHLKVTEQAISNVLRGSVTSERIASAVSKLINRPVNEIWPERYTAKAPASARLATLVPRTAARPTTKTKRAA